MANPLEVLASAFGEAAQKSKDPDYTPMDAETARRMVDVYLQPHAFKPGDLVRWKPGMKNRTLPDYGEPIPVLEVCAERRIAPEVVGKVDNAYGAEPLNIRIGAYYADHGLFGFWNDAARFEPWTPEPNTPVDASGDSAAPVAD